MNTISTHILDTSKGKPAEGILVTLFYRDQGDWRPVGKGLTNKDGRVASFAGDNELSEGLYELDFEVEQYLQVSGPAFYRNIKISFVVGPGKQHYHVPLLLNPFGYSTYRGS